MSVNSYRLNKPQQASALGERSNKWDGPSKIIISLFSAYSCCALNLEAAILYEALSPPLSV